MTFELRTYQRRLLDDIRFEFKNGKRRVCAVAPCGAGKTVMTAWMTRKAELKGNRILFMVHRKELIEQTSQTFSALGIRHGIISSQSAKEYDLPVQIASVQTLVKRIEEIPRPNFFICDECHHIVADTYRQIIDFWQPQLLGVTATPERLGGQGLGDVFQTLIIGPTVKELVKWGNLSPYDYYAPPSKFDPSKAKVKFGEYVQKDLIAQMDNADIIGDIVKYYKQLANNKRAICYCINRAHSKNVVKKFQEAGISAVHVDGETNPIIRSQAISDFRAGKINILSNVMLFGEGVDVPSMEAVILARPTASLTLYIQQSMRAMRQDNDNLNKRAIIIDHVGNVFRHGLPDEEREWTLETKPKKRKEFITAIKTCPNCLHAIKSSLRTCPICGYQFEVQEHVNTQNKNGQLLKISELERKNRLKKEVKNARTVEDLEKIARRRGYSMRWVTHQIELKKICRGG